MNKQTAKLYTANQLIKKYHGKYIDVYTYFYAAKSSLRNHITKYEVRGVSDTIRENYNLPEDCVIP